MKNQLVDPGAFLSQTKPEKHARYPYTDLGDGRLLADCYKQVIIYVPERKCWYVYRDGIWVQDLGGLQVMEYCKSLAVALKAYAQTIRTKILEIVTSSIVGGGRIGVQERLSSRMRRASGLSVSRHLTRIQMC